MDRTKWQVILLAIMTRYALATMPATSQANIKPFARPERPSQEQKLTWTSSSRVNYKDSQGFEMVADMNTKLSGPALTATSAPNNPDLTLDKLAGSYVFIWYGASKYQYVVTDSSSGLSMVLGPAGVSNPELSLAQWLPHPTENRIIFVYENDVYVKYQPFDLDAQRITFNGEFGTIFNGIADWVYYEEVFGRSNDAFYPSPLGSMLAYTEFDDSNVREVHFPVYGDPSDPYTYQYPERVSVRYPKTGYDNPRATIFVYDLEARNLAVPVEPPSELNQFTDGYIYHSAKWINEDVLSVTWSDRRQSTRVVSECRNNELLLRYECSTFYTLVEPSGWFEPIAAPIYTSDANYMFTIHPYVSPVDSLSYDMVARVGSPSGAVEYLTTGQFVVTSIEEYDEDNHLIYYTATEADNPGVRNIYTVQDSPGGAVTCLTCKTSINSTPCNMNSIKMSPDFTHYIQKCNVKTPGIAIRNTKTNEIVMLLEDTPKARQGTVPVEIKDTFPLPDGFTAYTKMLVPQGYNPSGSYPVLVDVYAGPGSQSVYDYPLYGDSWEEYMVAEYGIVYVFIDGRGSGYKSNEHLFQLKRGFGTVEVQDQIDVVQQLAQKYPFLDMTRTGIWGWSHGGYITGHVMGQDSQNVYKCGLSVAPNINVLFYDTIYTERYMDLPSDDPLAYEQQSVLNKVEGFRGKKYMVNSGTADDNVHYQQTIMLIKALELARVPFQQQSFPDQHHDIEEMTEFLYDSMERFWVDCFGF